jgi:peptidoglycan/LPS O-acetylase OafA/YrhL
VTCGSPGTRCCTRPCVAALPGLVTVAMALVLAVKIGDAEWGENHALLTIVEWSAFLALAVIWAWQPEVRTRRRFLRIVVALWGTTAFGLYHQILAYILMVAFSERDWDEPPGTGYVTVAAITISAILIAIMTLRAPQEGSDDEPHEDEYSRVGHPSLNDDSIRSERADFGAAAERKNNSIDSCRA